MLPARENEDENGRRYWALAGKPERYRLIDAVNELDFDSWTTVGRDLRPGDRVVIWKYKGRDRDRGAIALGEVLSFPEPASAREVDDFEYWIFDGDKDTVEDRAFIRYVKVLDPPLWLGGPHHYVVSKLSVSRSQGGTIFNVTPEQWEELLNAVGGWPADVDLSHEQADAVDEIEEIIKGQTSDRVYRQSAAERKAIEHYAMRQAAEHFRRHGWSVTDVSATRSYDLHCNHPDGVELHVEVKGTTGKGSSILLTANEVEHARSNPDSAALFVAYDIQLDVKGTNLKASGGSAALYDLWDVDSGELIPLTYQYQVPMGQEEVAEIYEGL